MGTRLIKIVFVKTSKNYELKMTELVRWKFEYCSSSIFQTGYPAFQVNT